jgi:hypothetical protein
MKLEVHEYKMPTNHEPRLLMGNYDGISNAGLEIDFDDDYDKVIPIQKP